MYGTIEVFEPFHYPPVIGDAYSLIPGCRKFIFQDCRDKYSNIPKLFGFTNVPTSAQ
ncbi:phage BR0599 family protein [Propionivibrio sp.]|uniref:phage BR0599 family protein n=1 Tax=Propionivibrio sp. TaxID=2212460 RepID=UPI003422DC57|nr:phage BR0599 family protein [Propionivibrio sp.]